MPLLPPTQPSARNSIRTDFFIDLPSGREFIFHEPIDPSVLDTFRLEDLECFRDRLRKDADTSRGEEFSGVVYVIEKRIGQVDGTQRELWERGLGYPIYNEQHEMVNFYEPWDPEGRDHEAGLLRSALVRKVLHICTADSQEFMNWVRKTDLFGLISEQATYTPLCGGTFWNEEEFDHWAERLSEREHAGLANGTLMPVNEHPVWWRLVKASGIVRNRLDARHPFGDQFKEYCQRQKKLNTSSELGDTRDPPQLAPGQNPWDIIIRDKVEQIVIFGTPVHDRKSYLFAQKLWEPAQNTFEHDLRYGLDSISSRRRETPAAKEAAVCYTRALKDIGALVGAMVPEYMLIAIRNIPASQDLNLQRVLKHVAKAIILPPWPEDSTKETWTNCWAEYAQFTWSGVLRTHQGWELDAGALCKHILECTQKVNMAFDMTTLAIATGDPDKWPGKYFWKEMGREDLPDGRISFFGAMFDDYAHWLKHKEELIDHYEATDHDIFDLLQDGVARIRWVDGVLEHSSGTYPTPRCRYCNSQ
jgi:hypothetical protein